MLEFTVVIAPLVSRSGMVPVFMDSVGPVTTTVTAHSMVQLIAMRAR